MVGVFSVLGDDRPRLRDEAAAAAGGDATRGRVRPPPGQGMDGGREGSDGGAVVAAEAGDASVSPDVPTLE